MAHDPNEFVLHHLPLGERLLATPLSGTAITLSGSPPWYWQTREIGLSVIDSGTVTGTADRLYDYVELDTGTYGPHIGTTLWLEVFTGTTGPSGSPHAISRAPGGESGHLGALGDRLPVRAPPALEDDDLHRRDARDGAPGVRVQPRVREGVHARPAVLRRSGIGEGGLAWRSGTS